MPLSRPRRRTLSIAVTVLAIIGLAGPGAVSADTELGHTGLTGAHRLRDVFGYPGARCIYEGPKAGEVLQAIRFRAPVVFARNATTGVDIQTVGWRGRLQKRVSGTWQTVASKTVVKDVATDRHPAEFTGKSFSISTSGTYRIAIDMYWYNAYGTSVVGSARHKVDRYAIVINGDQAFEDDYSCVR